MPAAYIIVDMKVSNPEQYKDYMAAAPAAVKAHGGEYLVRGGRFEVMEGDWQPARIAMLRFPSLEAAQTFYDAEQYRAAHEAYLADRASILEVDEIEGYSAGGMPTRVKCLHALIGHALAAGPGVNPIGDIALELCSWSPSRCVCESF